jgi:hypothetical protein
MAIVLDPGFAEVHRNIAWLYLTERNPDSALAELNRYEAMSGVHRPDIRAWSDILLGRRAEAQRLADSLARRSGGLEPFWAAMIYGQLGDRRSALSLLESASSQRLNVQITHPMFDPLRGDPQFNALIRRSGLSPTLQLPAGSARRQR